MRERVDDGVQVRRQPRQSPWPIIRVASSEPRPLIRDHAHRVVAHRAGEHLVDGAPIQTTDPKADLQHHEVLPHAAHHAPKTPTVRGTDHPILAQKSFTWHRGRRHAPEHTQTPKGRRVPEVPKYRA